MAVLVVECFLMFQLLGKAPEDIQRLGIGRRSELDGGGGDHSSSAGGYTTGNGDYNSDIAINGLTALDDKVNTHGTGIGSGYYNYCTKSSHAESYEMWFGERWLLVLYLLLLHYMLLNIS